MLGAAAYAGYLGAALLGYVSRGTRLEHLMVRPVLYALLYLLIPLAVFRAYALHGLYAFTRYSLLAVLCLAATLPYAHFASRRLCSGDQSCATAVMLTILFPNTVFLPLSIAPLEKLDIDVIMSYSLPLTLLHFTLGYRLGGMQPRRDVPSLVTGAALAGLAVDAAGLAASLDPLLRVISLVSPLTGYMAILVVGASMPRVSHAHLRDPLVYYALLWRSTASPLLHALLASLLSLKSPEEVRTVIVESLMPPATMNAVIARHVGADYERVATAILLLTPVQLVEALAALHLLTR